ncbi:DEAD/DEAH box helicase [Stygiolobus caldivivus]|uniref:DNA 3'-5' helicase n=1 Tax=Stygiolobus caldivivus TaxID=2824673 RepID=A0A8D5U865_9CREN|nr:DEAD/DEAH box helicase [Stygiolobus caldivivus]BCU71133.1 DNA methylase [Stygiolobus caldivivus]
MSLRTFYIQRWLDDDTFRKLLSFSRFITRDPTKGSVFVIDTERARKNRLKADDIRAILQEIGVTVDEKELKELEKELPNYDVEFVLRNEKVIIRPHVYLMDLVKDYYEQGILKYNKGEKVFETYPYYYQFLKTRFEENGLKVKGLELKVRDININLKAELREYQKEALDIWLEKGSGVIALPTGAGKTVIGVGAIAHAKRSALVVTFTKEQMMQWRDSILRFTDAEKAMIGLFYSGEKNIKPITITTYHTAYRHMGELGDKFDVLIIDEAHHLPADKFKVIALGSFASRRLALSATPVREDGKHEELFKLMGGLIYFKTPQELIKGGFLAPYEITQVRVDMTPQEKLEYNKLLSKFRSLSKGKKVSQLLELVKKGDEEAVEAMKVYNEMKKITNLAKNKVEKVKEIVEKEKGNKILVFTQYVEQAEEIAKSLNAFLITGKMSKSEREKVLSVFKGMKSGVLVLTTVGDEGLDIPDASVGIIVTGTGSRRQFIQRLGRLLRPSNGKKAKLYELITKGTAEEYQAVKRKEIIQEDSLFPDGDM